MERPKAASVLVIVDDKVLGFKSPGRGIGMPGGKVDPGETYAQAAVRECKEETGYDVELFDVPYIGTDNSSVYEVATFKARIIGGELLEQASPEGIPMWVDMDDLLTGKYHEYNKNMLQFFNIM